MSPLCPVTRIRPRTMAQGQAGLVADDKTRVQGFGESSGAVVHCRAEPVCVC